MLFVTWYDRKRRASTAARAAPAAERKSSAAPAAERKSSAAQAGDKEPQDKANSEKKS